MFLLLCKYLHSCLVHRAADFLPSSPSSSSCFSSHLRYFGGFGHSAANWWSKIHLHPHPPHLLKRSLKTRPIRNGLQLMRATMAAVVLAALREWRCVGEIKVLPRKVQGWKKPKMLLWPCQRKRKSPWHLNLQSLKITRHPLRQNGTLQSRVVLMHYGPC